MKTAVGFVGSQLDFNLFSRFHTGLTAAGYRLILLTCKPSLWLYSRLQKIPCFLVKNSENIMSNPYANMTTEVLCGEVGENAALRFYYGVMENAEIIHSDGDISLILIWNGSSIPTKALSVFAQLNNIPALYFELSNIPGKLFVDPKGVNAQSLLFHKPNILDNYSIDEQQFEEWRRKYLEYKRTESITPLAKKYRGIKNILFPIDSFATRFLNIPVIGEMNIIRKTKDIAQKSDAYFLFDEYDISSGIFNFFPMQVSNDSQLLFNTSVTMHDAIEIAYKQSREQGRDLLIKPHPVEREEKIFKYLLSLQNKDGLYIVNKPTFNIVERCQQIITINSTVGLEGLIAGKKVAFLGKSFYSMMNEEQLKKYLMKYLIDVDYFSNEDISAKLIKTILSRVLIK